MAGVPARSSASQQYAASSTSWVSGTGMAVTVGPFAG